MKKLFKRVFGFAEFYPGLTKQNVFTVEDIFLMAAALRNYKSDVLKTEDTERLQRVLNQIEALEHKIHCH